jgi:hypothetical protein
MAHYAFLDDNNIVTEVITGRDEWEVVDGITDWEQAYGEIRGQVCKRTSYNGNIRYNYAGIGYKYDEVYDAFIAPEPSCGHPEIVLNDLMRWECSNAEHVAELQWLPGQ